MNDCRSLRAYQCWVTWQEAKKNHVAMEQAKAAEREAIDQMQRIQQDMTDLLAKTKKEIDEYRRSTGNAKKYDDVAMSHGVSN